ncbi:hypothetical protein BJ912DRAFT_1058822 [Pholiota molesta]|nr:hypothetical protein BJ912DRAFT_1058822 [Pholiota molesta]
MPTAPTTVNANDDVKDNTNDNRDDDADDDADARPSAPVHALAPTEASDERAVLVRLPGRGRLLQRYPTATTNERCSAFSRLLVCLLDATADSKERAFPVVNLSNATINTARRLLRSHPAATRMTDEHCSFVFLFVGHHHGHLLQHPSGPSLRFHPRHLIHDE